MEPPLYRPWVPQGTLETEFPLPLYSDQYVTLWGPRGGPVLRQAERWKLTPLGWDAAGQSWSTGLSGAELDDPWYSITRGIASGRWQRAHSNARSPLPPVYDQHLREVACWDPIIPAAYPGPRTRWGAFLWQERPILGKEYVATRSQSPGERGGSAGYVPLLSSCRLPGTACDVSTWGLLQHQPSTRQ